MPPALRQLGIDDGLRLRLEAQPAAAGGEVDACEAPVELLAPECDHVHLRVGHIGDEVTG